VSLLRQTWVLAGLLGLVASCGGGGGSTQPPSFRIESVAIEPAQPTAEHELRATHVLVNPANTSVSISYEWRRNGAVLAGRNAATLPAGQHRRNDQIAVVVRASDGRATVETQNTVLIGDAPPRIVITAAPSVNFGAALAGTAAIFDTDGDTYPNARFQVQHGPAGLTVHPISGLVAWTASLPMLDATVDVNWSIGTNDPSIQRATAAVRVVDPSRSYPLVRTGLPVPFQQNLRVGDFDGDGDQEMLMLGVNAFYELEAVSSSTYRQAWASAFAIAGGRVGRSFAVGDTDGDRKLEIFIAANRTIAKLDGANRRRIASIDQDGLECQQLEYADLDRDGRGEIICLGRQFPAGSVIAVTVFSAADLTLRWRFPDAAYGDAVGIGNVDDDAALEIVSAAGHVFDGATFATEWHYTEGFGQDVAVGDLDNNGVAEIVGLRGAAGANGVRAFDARAGARRMLWQFATQDSSDSILLADADGDSVTDIVIGQFGRVTGYHFNTAANAANIVFTFLLPFAVEFNARALGVGDVDHDGQQELIWATNGRRGAISVAGFNSQPAVVEWTNAPLKQLDGPFVGGAIARNGAADAVLFATPSTNDNLGGPRLVAMQRDSGDVSVSGELAGGGRVALGVGDVDGDSVDEAILSTTQHLNVYDPFGSAIEWQELASGFPVAVAVGDVTRDGRPDAVSVFEDGRVVAYDVYGRTTIWSAFVANRGRDVAIADLNSDSSPEIVVVTERAVTAYSRTNPPGTFAQSGQHSSIAELHALTIGDTDGSGAVELFAVMGDVTRSEGWRVQVLDNALRPQAIFFLDRPASDIAVEPTAHTRRNLLVAAIHNLGSVDDFGTIDAIDARTGAVVWRSPPLPGPISPGGLYYYEASGGRPVLAFATEGGMYLTR
jgi:hypothetical protein